MPLCCAIKTQEFFNEVVTTVPFTGDAPTVKVYYTDGSGYIEAGVFTQIVLGVDEITITHGGPATGIVKIIQ